MSNEEQLESWPGRSQKDIEANARRIYACVKACKEIPTERLESLPNSHLWYVLEDFLHRYPNAELKPEEQT